jgi:hypothetical protein
MVATSAAGDSLPLPLLKAVTLQGDGSSKGCMTLLLQRPRERKLLRRRLGSPLPPAGGGGLCSMGAEPALGRTGCGSYCFFVIEEDIKASLLQHRGKTLD